MVLSPPTLSVTLTAVPVTGQAPLEGVDLTASLSGSARGPVTFHFDCNNDGIFEKEVTEDSDHYTAEDVCGYTDPGTYTAKVMVERAEVTATADITLTVAAATESTPSTGDSVIISMLDNVFSPRDATVKPGATVIWKNDGARPHTATSDDGLWDSGNVDSGQSWSWKVPDETTAGTDFPYYCVYHGDKGGQGMAGILHVGSASPGQKTLFVSVSVNPDAGEAPLQDVDITVQVSGTATGDITYRIDCNGDGTFEDENTIASDTYRSADLCSYDSPGAYTVKVAVERDGLTAEATTTINVLEPPPSSTGDTVVIAMQDNFFSPKDVTVKAGATIIWDNVGNRPHTSTSDDGIWDSGNVDSGQSWSWQVPEATADGTSLPYFCVYHGNKGGQGMAGVIYVGTQPPPSSSSDTVNVSMIDNFFSPRDVTVKPGATVRWRNVGLMPHTTTSDDGIWDSGKVDSGATWSWTVPDETQSGTVIPYFCVYHGDKGGQGMTGVINVSTSAQQQPTLSVTLTASPPAGMAPLKGVDFTAQVSGTVEGAITYHFDCNSDGVYEEELTTNSNIYTAVDLYDYNDPGSYVAKVVVERGGLTAETSIVIEVSSPQPPTNAEVVTVSMRDNFFSPRDVTVKPGAKIIWENGGIKPHTATSDDGLWDSGTVNTGGSYSWTVPTATQSGTDFPYFCVFHGDKGGQGMAGVIHVSTGNQSPTLSVALSAEPSSGEAPLENVALIAQVSGTVTGPITYRFDCTGDGTFEHETTTDQDFYQVAALCSYSSAGDHTAKVVAERGGLNANASTTITVSEPPPPSSGREVRVLMKDNFFSPREVTVKPGEKIIWDNVGKKPHTSTSDDGLWDSGTVNTGGSYSWTVPTATQSGTDFPYFCVFHGDKGGQGMAGVIHVSTGNQSPTLSVALSAEPSSGEAPLENVALIAQVSGTVTGPITYRFDCTGDGTFEHETTTDQDFYQVAALCSYSSAGDHTAKVVAERGGLNANASTTITVSEPPPPQTGGDVTIAMKDNFFSPRNVTVNPGAKITWNNSGRKKHTSTSDTGLWDSGTVNTGGSYSWTVPADAQDGTSFPYFCIFHGDRGGQGMAGSINVGSGGGSNPPPSTGNTVVVTTPGKSFSPERVEIQPGDTVTWQFSGTTHNVTFEKEAPSGGDIPDSEPGTEVSRTFTNEGDYDYECTLHHGQKGRIRVRTDLSKL
ncbi:MAG: cupredoxin domain-containing protein [bacterium]